MRIKNIELWAAALTILIISAGYLSLISLSAIPAASSLLGHGLGIAGFVLMLMTETLYSLRKKYQFARWGKLEHWLSFHIYTGLVGPFLVLLHTSWKFQGLAGVLTLMTLIIVISGFIGRYFYTSIPRTVEGSALEASTEIKQSRSERNRKLLAIWHTIHVPLALSLFLVAVAHILAALYYSTLLH